MKRHTTNHLVKLLCTMLVGILFLTSNTQIHAENRTTIRVGFFPFSGYHVEDEDGNKSGYGYELLQEMLVYENWQYEYIGYEEQLSWEDSLAMLKEGKIDLLSSATMNEDRLQDFLYSDQPIGVSSTMVTTRAGDNRYDTSDYQSWSGAKVGLLGGNSRNESFQKYATEHDFFYTTKEYETSQDLVQGLKDGEVDMIVSSNLLEMSGVHVVTQFDEKPFYVIVEKSNQALMDQVNDALKKLSAQNPNFAMDLYDQYYNPVSEGVVSYTKEEQAYIDECKATGKVFTAVINCDRKPLVYQNDGVAGGLLVDLSNTIFERSGLKIEFESKTSREEYIQAISNQEPDIICDYTGTQTKAEKEGYIDLAHYYTSTLSMLVRNGYDGTGNRCALTSFSATNTSIVNDQNYEFSYYETMEDCAKAVKDGQADFLFGYTRVLQELVYEDETNSITCFNVPGESVDFKLAVNLEEDALLSSILLKSTSSLNDADITKMSEPYTYYLRSGTSVTRFVYENPVLSLVILGCLIVGAFTAILAILFSHRHREAERINEQLTTTLQEAEKANRAKTDFLARMSHDMRTPLNAIKNYTLFITNANSLEEAQDYGNKVITSEKYLETLINDTLGMSRIESGKVELQLVPLRYEDLEPGIRNVVETKAEEKKIALEFTSPINVKHSVLVDRLRIQQILVNIVNNAIKFTPEGGKVTIVTERFDVTDTTETIQFTISDTGRGMNKDFLENKLFKPFAQERQGEDNEHTGTGLGMSIVKNLVDLMHGTIRCMSEEGKGTTFIVCIPVTIANDETMDTAVRHEIDLSVLRGKKILVAEDHPLNQEITKKILENVGCHVTIACDGEKVIEEFEQSECNFYDAILMDIRMPHKNGLEATAVIRHLDREDAKRIPIVAMTANAFDEDKQEAISVGMNAHLSKPIDAKVMLTTLESFMQKES